MIGTNVTVTLSSPNDVNPYTVAQGILASKNLTVVNPGVEVSAGNCMSLVPANPECYMQTGVFLTQEFIDFKDSEIDMRILAGGTNGSGQPVTGFAAGAQWVFSNLNPTNETITGITHIVGAGQVITGPQVTFDQVTDLIRVSLDNIVFTPSGNGQSDSFADVQINLLTSPTSVPEPGSIWFVGLGLISAYGASRFSKRSLR